MAPLSVISANLPNGDLGELVLMDWRLSGAYCTRLSEYLLLCHVVLLNISLAFYFCGLDSSLKRLLGWCVFLSLTLILFSCYIFYETIWSRRQHSSNQLYPNKMMALVIV